MSTKLKVGDIVKVTHPWCKEIVLGERGKVTGTAYGKYALIDFLKISGVHIPLTGFEVYVELVSAVAVTNGAQASAATGNECNARSCPMIGFGIQHSQDCPENKKETGT